MTREASTDPQGLTVSDLLNLPPVTDIVTAGKAFGMGSTKAYQLAKSDQFPCKVVRVGGSYRVVTADMLRVLCVPENAEDAAAA
ncbi:DNA-binding protein [Streptomyces sp. NPDC005820]|uniref:DNA-binding protein n=1 Tax=Streptomyces sp. NPDC005820 TaxID=3157069 RepID=UPI0033E5D1AA